MKNVLIIDTETTGIDPATSTVIELGAVLYSVKHQTTIAQFSSLYHAPDNPCEHINRIPASAVRESVNQFESSDSSQSLLGNFADSADAYVAHNAKFDQSFLGWNDKPWLCTCFDFNWSKANRQSGSLVNLALEYGIGVSSAHRALTDCQLIAALFDRCENLQEMIALASRPKAVFVAMVSYDDRQLAKDAGFKWNGQTRTWTRQMVIEEASELEFPVKQI